MDNVYICVYLQGMRIYITGFMGSGKSTVGRQLASLLKYQFIDLDICIEKEVGLKVLDIFSKHGEVFFRNAENSALLKTFHLDNIVVSTGGGTPCFLNNMQLINKNGVSIYLKLSVDALVSRLSQSSRKRPLIADLSEDEIWRYVHELLIKRQDSYKQAKHVIEGLNIKANDLMILLINDLSGSQ
jgi:shikimate kinase